MFDIALLSTRLTHIQLLKVNNLLVNLKYKQKTILKINTIIFIELIIFLFKTC